MFFSKKSLPPARVHEIVAAPPQFDKLAANRRLRLGMWVVADKNVGILTALAADGRAEVTLTNADGTNKVAIVTQATSLRQAAFSDIPVARRPSMAQALAYGYREKRSA